MAKRPMHTMSRQRCLKPAQSNQILAVAVAGAGAVAGTEAVLPPSELPRTVHALEKNQSLKEKKRAANGRPESAVMAPAGHGGCSHRDRCLVRPGRILAFDRVYSRLSSTTDLCETVLNGSWGTRATRTIHPASRRAAWSSREGPRGVQSGWQVERPGSSWDAITDGANSSGGARGRDEGRTE